MFRGEDSDEISIQPPPPFLEERINNDDQEQIRKSNTDQTNGEALPLRRSRRRNRDKLVWYNDEEIPDFE